MASIRLLKRKKGEAYQIDYYDYLGKRKRQIIFGDLKTANRIRAELEIDTEKYKLGLKVPPLTSPKLSVFIIEYLKNREGEIASSTVLRDKYTLKRFLKHIGDIPLVSIGAKQIDDYIVDMRSSLSKATIGIELRHLKTAFNRALRWEYIETNPLLGIKIPDGQPDKIRVLSKDEIKRLLAIADDPEIHDVIEVYLGTGARRSELLRPKFTWDSVDFNRNRLRFLGKGNKTRYVQMTSEIAEIFQIRSKQNLEYPFRFRPDWISHKLRLYYKAAKIKNATLHTLRKTFGSLLIQEGHADIYTVSKLLGHSSVKVTERHYILLLDENYQSCIDGLGTTLKSLAT